MKLLVITFSTDDTNPGLLHLKASLEHYGYDYHFLIGPEYSWGGDNYVLIAEWLKSNRQDYTHILYTDAWDTLAMAGPDEVERCYESIRFHWGFSEVGYQPWVYSGEKNHCFTIDITKYHPDSPWKYLCAGGYITPIDLFIDVVEKQVRPAGENDQVWGSKNFESEIVGIVIDTECDIFQTMYDMGPFHVEPNRKEFEMKDGRLLNKVTGTKPIFIHGNGKVDMRSIYHEFREYIKMVEMSR